MPPKAKASTKQKATAEPATREPEFKFDPRTQEVVLDLKGLHDLPTSDFAPALGSLRALVLPRGKHAHVPKLAGKYFVLGKFHVKHALAVVHFKPELNRPPELHTKFFDYGLHDYSMTGVMVESYLLPLKVAQGVYQSQPRYTSVTDVIGWSKVDTFDISAKELEAFLKRLDHFAMDGIVGEDTMLSHIALPLGERVDTLHNRVIGKLEADRDAAGQKPDEAHEEYLKQLSIVNTLVAKIHELPVTNYDASLNTRIHCMEDLHPPDHTEQQTPAWLTSPLKRELDEGSLAANVTRLLEDESQPQAPRLEPSPVQMRTRSSPGPSGLMAEKPEDGDDEGGEEEDELVSDSDESSSPEAVPEPAVGEKRSRKQVQAYAPGADPPNGKGKAKAAVPAKVKKPRGARARASAARANLEAGGAPFGRKLNGEPYKRACGGYKNNLSRLISKAASSAPPAPRLSQESSGKPKPNSDSFELIKARGEIERLEGEIKQLTYTSSTCSPRVKASR